ncbi:MAG TPA: glycosyltransferase family 39 protein [Candidatus Kapabacteria bacterium]|nr:glycosyltransferase family 39 protein [Candidatus Kapabacteria bacterium]
MSFEKRPSILLVLLLFLGGMLRVFHLDTRDFWYDEAFTGVLVREEWGRMMEIIIADTHPPLYYIFVKLFAMPFDYSVFGIRFFSVICGVLGIYGVYVCGKELVHRRAGMYASFLLTVSPFGLYYAQEARMYALLACLTTFAWYFFLKAIRTASDRSYIAWGILCSLSILTHYMGFISLACMGAVYLFQGGRDVWRKRHGAWVLTLREYLINKSLWLGLGIGTILFLPWVRYFLLQFATKEEKISWIEPAVFADVFRAVQMFLFGIPPGELSMGMPEPNELLVAHDASVFALLLITLALLLVYVYLRDRITTMVLGIASFGYLLFVYILSLAGFDYFVVRYLIPSAYFFYILFGWWLSLLSLRKRMLVICIYCTLLLSIVPYHPSQGFTLLRDHDPYPGKRIYVLNTFDYVIAKYYFGYDRVVLFNLDWPEYNPKDWLGVNGKIQRVERIADMGPDPVILVHTQSNPVETFQKLRSHGQFRVLAQFDYLVLLSTR